MIKDLREKVKMYMQLYLFTDVVKKDSSLCESSREGLSLMRSFFVAGHCSQRCFSRLTFC